MQFVKKSGLTNMQKELQVQSFLAGWAIRFLQLRTGDPDIDEADVFSTFYKKGDYAFNSPQHHGTKKTAALFFPSRDMKSRTTTSNIAYAKAESFVVATWPNPPPVVPQNDVFAKNLGLYYERIPQPRRHRRSVLA